MACRTERNMVELGSRGSDVETKEKTSGAKSNGVFQKHSVCGNKKKSENLKERVAVAKGIGTHPLSES